MTVNESKKMSPRQWDKWKASGAVGTIEDSRLRTLRSIWSNLSESDKVVSAMGIHYAGPAKGCSTLSLGNKVINRFVSQPAAYIVAPGNDYKLGQHLTDLPEGAQPLENYFGRN